jgi:hypothetical protein
MALAPQSRCHVAGPQMVLAIKHRQGQRPCPARKSTRVLHQHACIGRAAICSHGGRPPGTRRGPRGYANRRAHYSDRVCGPGGRVFSGQSPGLPAHGPQDMVIELRDGKQSPWVPIHNLSEKELTVLREYIETNLKRSWIRPSTTPAGAPVLFVPKKDGAIRLCVDY